jgi:hypothetical protein
MRVAHLVFMAMLPLTWYGTAADAAEKIDLSVFYVGNPSTPRGKSYTAFLSQSFRRVEAAERRGFDPKKAAGFDVVLLDWSQSDRQAKAQSPLGPKDAWNKPTVLLGSAGLLLAEVWKIHGAIG